MESLEGKSLASHILKNRSTSHELKLSANVQNSPQLGSKPNQVSTVLLYGIPIVSLVIEAQERLCLAQISNTLLKQFSYNEIHNRRVALGITCVQCTPVQLEILRRAGAMPVSSRRCGMITRREAERLCKSFLGDNAPPRLPDDFAFHVFHECAWGCRGNFLPSRYNSSRAKCIKCTLCGLFFSPNKFIFHSHRTGPNDKYIQPDAANFNSWRRHMKLSGNCPDEIEHAWEDVKAMFNGGTRKRLMSSHSSPITRSPQLSPASKTPKLDSNCPVSPPILQTPSARVPQFEFSRSLVMDFWQSKQFQFPPYAALPWLKRPLMFSAPDPPLLALQSNLSDVKPLYGSAFRPVAPLRESDHIESHVSKLDSDTDDEVDIETTEDDVVLETSNDENAKQTSPDNTWGSDKDMISSNHSRDISPILNVPIALGVSSIVPKREPSPITTQLPAAPVTSQRNRSELWSVAKLTQEDSSEATSRSHLLDRLPFYRHDIRHYSIRDPEAHNDCSECLRGRSRTPVNLGGSPENSHRT